MREDTLTTHFGIWRDMGGMIPDDLVVIGSLIPRAVNVQWLTLNCNQIIVINQSPPQQHAKYTYTVFVGCCA